MDKPRFTICNSSFKYVIITAQCFALLPFSKIKTSLNDLNFKWKSFKVFYNIFITSVLVVFLIFEMIYCSSNDFQMYQLTAMIQKATSILVLIQNIKLASKWPKLMKQWCQSDLIMNRRYGYLKNFNRKMKICLALYFVSTLGYINSLVVAAIDDSILRLNFYSFIFNYVPYNFLFGLLFFLVYTVHFFLSNFNDMFIISLSMALALRFKQIRNRLEYNERNNHKIGMSDFWLEMRRDYDRLFHICKNLDDCINGLILISFSYNMYFVISYLYHQLMIENNRGQIVMFYCFFPYLALRVFAVCLYTSWINDESLGPVNILNSIQSRDYNPEIGRWLVQMSFDDVALTGGKIFKIKRSIFLSVVGIVVTYELVFMQFHGFSSKV